MYRVRLFILFSILLSLISGCIERYYPSGEEIQTGTLVVVAHLTNVPGVQSIHLTRSSTLEIPKYDPVSGCYVEVERSDGLVREFEESRPGEYSSFLDESFLTTGSEYRLVFVTPDGSQYESEFEKLHPAPDINAVYFTREDRPTADPEKIEEGIQFYIDFDIEKDSGRYLRWQLIETYEMHNPDYLSTSVYDVDRRFKDIPDSMAWRSCWITLEIPEIFTLDLGSVAGSNYKQMPLNFVSSETQRLHHRYSLLVRQLSLSKTAFWYWDELGKNLQSKGGLFDTQPSLTPSNICNLDNEDEMIIGYFSISGVSEKRLSFEDVPDLETDMDPYFCAPGGLPKSFWRLSEKLLPYYMATLTIDGLNQHGGVMKECIDCREYKGSTHIKPDFWND
ncbi:MAG: DUF4249 domain-containing protein [Bacteroidota bacterium]